MGDQGADMEQTSRMRVLVMKGSKNRKHKHRRVVLCEESHIRGPTVAAVLVITIKNQLGLKIGELFISSMEESMFYSQFYSFSRLI